MVTSLLLWIAACDGTKDDSSGTGPSDDSATSDDSGTNKTDDTGVGCTELEWYEDLDHDGYGGGQATLACESPGKEWIAAGGDCDDSLVDVNPGAVESCNDIDDDCDQAIDDKDDDVSATVWYPDADADGYGDFAGAAVASCGTVTGHAPDDAKHGADCDDADDTVYPGALELCDDVQQDCATKGWAGDIAVATWYPASGGYEDWTDDLAVGKYGKAAKVPIEDDGELVICDGTWYVGLFVKKAVDVTITGLHGSAATTISGGDNVRPLSVIANDAVVTARGLTLTEGDACYGAAITTVDVLSCGSGGASANWFYRISLALSDVRVENNTPSLPATAAVVLAEGSGFTMENSVIANNSVMAAWVVDQPFSCKGDAKTDAGIWGNAYGGVSMLSLATAGTTPMVLDSDSCDFDGSGALYSPSWDVQVQNLEGYTDLEYGDDASFVCDANSLSCTK